MTVQQEQSDSQGNSNSYVPDYEPQLSFLRQFGNYSRGAEDSAWDWANRQAGRGDALTNSLVTQGYDPSSYNSMTAARQDMSNYNQMFAPALQSMDQDRQYYNSAQGQANEMLQSESTTAQAFQAQRKNLESDLGSFGIDTSDANNKFAPQLKAMDTRAGAALAASGNQAYQAAQATGRGLTQEELQTLARLPGQSSTDLNVAFQGLQGASNADQGSTALGALIKGTAPQYLQTGIDDVKFQPLGHDSTSESHTTSSGA